MVMVNQLNINTFAPPCQVRQKLVKNREAVTWSYTVLFAC